MKVFNLSGQSCKMDVRSSQYPMRSEESCKSKLQFSCGKFLKQKYPYDVILEEVPVPGEKLFLDFFLPSRKIIIEIDGAQHGEFNKFFHKTQANFKNAENRDSLKEKWAAMNSFIFVRVSSLEELESIFNES